MDNAEIISRLKEINMHHSDVNSEAFDAEINELMRNSIFNNRALNCGMREAPSLTENSLIIALMHETSPHTKLLRARDRAVRLLIDNGHDINRPVCIGGKTYRTATEELLRGETYTGNTTHGKVYLPLLRMLLSETDFSLLTYKQENQLHVALSCGAKVSNIVIERILGTKHYFGPLLNQLDSDGNTPLHKLASQVPRRDTGVILPMTVEGYHRNIERLVCLAERFGVQAPQKNNDGLSVIDAISQGVDPSLAAKLQRRSLDGGGESRRRLRAGV